MLPFTHHHLTAELVNDKHGPGLLLSQQEGIDDAQTLMMHPEQLRAVCEQFGIITPDATAARTIATLQRRLAALRDRIDSLALYMAKHGDHEHADLSYEMTQLNALADLAGEWCADFEALHDAPDSLTVQGCTQSQPAGAQVELL